MLPPPPPPGDASADHLAERVLELSRLAARRLAILAQKTATGPQAERARQLADHVRSYLLPRARSLDTPVVVLLLGPTGAGKSTLLNTVAAAPVSRTGVLRPTTREAVLLATEDDARRLIDGGPLAGLGRRIEIVAAGARPGVAVVDAPDIDSVETDNRALADVLVEAADLCVFVTTATRYADRVPWDVLGRVQQRRLPLVVVVNRLPSDAADARAVTEDVERMLGAAGFGAQADGDPPDGQRTPRMQVIAVGEGELAEATDGLDPARVQLLLDRMSKLATDHDARRALAARALAGALAGIGSLVHDVADDLEHEAIEVEAARRLAQGIYAEETRTLTDDLRRGTFLREEVLRQWHTFVGADQITRLFSSGIGRVRGTIVGLFRGAPPAPIAAVEAGATSDLTALVTAHAAEAARRTAARWAERPATSAAVADEPDLWSPSPDLADRLETRLTDWIAAIAMDVQTTGQPKRSLARGASIGVNAAGITVMLSTFAHTGGLTGAEVGVAAATAVINQKLLHALFGEAAVKEMIDRARTTLLELLERTMGEERARFDGLIGDPSGLRELAASLRSTVSELTAAA
jgi:energy-coupling factor transporter ATP-binding protein EcfA2